MEVRLDDVTFLELYFGIGLELLGKSVGNVRVVERLYIPEHATTEEVIKARWIYLGPSCLEATICLASFEHYVEAFGVVASPSVSLLKKLTSDVFQPDQENRSGLAGHSAAGALVKGNHTGALQAGKHLNGPQFPDARSPCWVRPLCVLRVFHTPTPSCKSKRRENLDQEVKEAVADVNLLPLTRLESWDAMWMVARPQGAGPLPVILTCSCKRFAGGASAPCNQLS